MAAAKPVTITQVATNAYSGPAPQPLKVVGTLPGGSVPTATTATAGVVKQGAVIANATTFADLAAAVTAYNALLTNLRAAGIIASA